jgi:TrmH family RNA methyltransferase
MRSVSTGELARDLERRGIDVILAADDVFSALSPVRTPSGIAAIGARPRVPLETICRHPDAFVIVAADVQDPGNVGSLLRAAEAAGMTGGLVAGASADPFSWKALRGSMGSALRLPVAAGIGVADAIGALKAGGVRTVASVARGGVACDVADWRGRIAVIVGGEGPGLSPAAVAQCDARVTIPMAPGVESINVAVAAGILAYAARRQRV